MTHVAPYRAAERRATLDAARYALVFLAELAPRQEVSKNVPGIVAELNVLLGEEALLAKQTADREEVLNHLVERCALMTSKLSESLQMLGSAQGLLFDLHRYGMYPGAKQYPNAHNCIDQSDRIRRHVAGVGQVTTLHSDIAFDLWMRKKLAGEGLSAPDIDGIMGRRSDGTYASVRVAGAYEGWCAR